MKPAFKRDAAFVADVRRVLNSRQRALWWLGQSGFLIADWGGAILLDPYLSDSLTHKYANTDKPHVRMTERAVSPEALTALDAIEAITSSHNHTDHFDPDTLTPLLSASSSTKLLLPAANRNTALERLGAQFAPQLVEIDAGQSIALAGFEVSAVASAHPTVEKDAAGKCRFLGYVIRSQDFTIYHSGDTLWHDDLVRALSKFSIDLALLPINGDVPERRVAGNLNGPQAAQLAKQINARRVIPCHFDMFEFNTASPAEFVSECRRLGQPYRILATGERVRF